jgi:hypothetical protein
MFFSIRPLDAKQAALYKGLMRILFVLVALAGVSLAIPIIPAANITACTIQGVSVPCPTNANTSSTNATTIFSATGLDTDAGIEISAFANAFDTGLPDISHSSFAFITFDVFAYTAGPIRPGLATFLVSTDRDNGPDGFASATSSISGLSTICSLSPSIGLGCHEVGTLVPFTLGIPFELRVSASGGSSLENHSVEGGGDGGSLLQLQLFELSGAPVTITALPEPGVWVLTGTGLVGLFWGNRSRPKSTRI